MPFQSLPPLVIITVAFGAAGGLMKLNNYMFLGRSDRRLRVDPFDIRMNERDVLIDWRRKEVEKCKDKAVTDVYTPEQIQAKIMTGPIQCYKSREEAKNHPKQSAGILRTHFFQKP